MFTEFDAIALKAAGYEMQIIPECWMEIGGAERGPKIIGHPELEEWTKGNHQVVVNNKTREVMEIGYLPQDPEGWEEQF